MASALRDSTKPIAVHIKENKSPPDANRDTIQYKLQRKV